MVGAPIWETRPMTRTTLILAAILLLPVAALSMPQVNAQGPIPYYGDGQAHNRGVPHAAIFPPRQYLVQQYEPPSVPPDIIAPERPRVSPRQPKAAPPIVILPLDPPEPEPTTPAPAPTVPAESMPNPLTEMVWSGGERQGAAVPQHGITEGAAMMRLLFRFSAGTRRP